MTLSLNSPGSKHFVTINGRNKSIYTGNEYDIYFNDCSNGKIGKYAVVELITGHNIGNYHKQNQ